MFQIKGAQRHGDESQHLILVLEEKNAKIYKKNKGHYCTNLQKWNTDGKSGKFK